jgi:nitrite reductase (NO-forming)
MPTELRAPGTRPINVKPVDRARRFVLGGLVVCGLLVLGLAALTLGGCGDGDDAAPTAAQAAESADGPVKFEKYAWVDPTLPPVPPGPVKEFEIDVFEHVTKVSDEQPPTRVWSYAINGRFYRGTGVSGPIVVDEGDRVHIVLRNGSSEAMDVKFPHSIDFHSSEVAPDVAFATIGPGQTHEFSFTAEHPGVYMYHCATAPVLHHTAAGMVGMMIVRPRGLEPVDRELWINQQEYYLGAPGEDADYEKAQAKAPDVIAFNGYGKQYLERKPIPVERGETVRMYVLNSGPSIWSAFHVIGTVFDRAVTDNGTMNDVQTINLAPSQGGFVEFTLDEEGTYPFVTHAFGDMEKGAVGALATAHAGQPAAH